MRRYRKVVWNEGMFIAPQHFQQQERHLQHYVEKYAALTNGQADYGVSALTLDTDRLKLGKIAVRGCRGIFPDATYVECDQELILDVPPATIEKRVFLALPIAIDGESEYGSRAEKRRYFQENATLFDAADSASHAIEAPLAEPNVRLVLEGEDVTGLSIMPIARVLERREGGGVVLDQSFIPCCLNYSASSVISERLKEIRVLTETRINNVLQRIQSGSDRKSELSLLREYQWLQALNRWLPWFYRVQANPYLSTTEVYWALVAYSAELCSFEPSIASEPPALVADNMNAAFAPLFSRLRDQLSLVQGDSVSEYEWDTNLFEKRRLLRASVPDLQAREGHRFVLAVESSIGTRALAAVFPAACKLSGLNRIADVVRNGISGVTLHALPSAPAELKPRPDVCYIEIDTRHDDWQDIIEHREALAMHIDHRIPDLSVTLYALG